MSMIGQRIAYLRQINGISQERLADLLGTGRSTIIRYENGQTFPNSEVIISLCNIFEVSSDYLLGLDKNESSLPSKQASHPISAKPEIEINITKNVNHSPQQLNTLSIPENIQQYIDHAVESTLLRYIKK